MERIVVVGAKRQRFEAILNYLAKRSPMMNYDELAAQDLELSSGMVEGAVRYVIGQRFDEGGLRWIRERAEALLQLRCVESNGDWERFVQFLSTSATASTPNRKRDYGRPGSCSRSRNRCPYLELSDEHWEDLHPVDDRPRHRCEHGCDLRAQEVGLGLLRGGLN